ncbi:MAG: hypothetical protein PHD19_09595 [Dechloromonas sp.]|nr:hypothetical protein [Dechloromonas sp.]
MSEKSWFQSKFDKLPKDRQDRIRRLLDNYNPEPVFRNNGAEPDWSHLNCPMCGGSGHVDDVTPNAGGNATERSEGRVD